MDSGLVAVDAPGERTDRVVAVPAYLVEHAAHCLNNGQRLAEYGGGAFRGCRREVRLLVSGAPLEQRPACLHAPDDSH